MSTRLASPRLVAQLQSRVQQGFYGDTAYLLQSVGTGVFDDNNTETVAVHEIPLECSFTDNPSPEKWRDYADIEEINAEIRFKGHNPNKGDQVRVQGRFDSQSFQPKTFEIVGIRNRDVFGWVCALKAVSL